MKVLIIHDRDEIRNQIFELISNVSNEFAAVSQATNFFEARNEIVDNVFDLVVIDLTLPYTSTSKEPPTYNVALELLKEIYNNSKLNIPSDIIGITKDRVAYDSINLDFGGHLMTTIFEEQNGKWKDELREKLTYFKKSYECRTVNSLKQHFYDLAIITALDEEMVPFEGKTGTQNGKHIKNSKEFVFHDNKGTRRKGVMISIGESGQAPSASFTQSILTYYRPKLIIMSGICGGYSEKVKIGDVMVFEDVYAWDFGKHYQTKAGDEVIMEDYFKPRPSPISIKRTLPHDVARELSQRSTDEIIREVSNLKHIETSLLTKSQTHLKSCGSGNSVIASKKTLDKIREMNDSIWAIDMESFGFYFSCSTTPVATPSFICIKSVSDYCDKDKDDSYHRHACEVAADFTWYFATQKWNY